MQRNVLEQKRVAKGLTRAELAALAGVSVPTLFRWEKQQMPISWDSLLKLAQALEVKPVDILPELDVLPEKEPTHVG